MAVLPVSQESTAPPAESLEDRFRRLEETWRREVGHFSNSEKLRNHWAFQEIIGLGDAVVPLMLRDLEREPRLWVWALPKITGANPVPSGEAGNIAKMSEAWVRWGRANGKDIEFGLSP